MMPHPREHVNDTIADGEKGNGKWRGNGSYSKSCAWKDIFHLDHQADLLKSGISPETANALSIHTVVPRWIAKHLGFNDERVTSLLCFPYPGEDGFCRDKLWPTDLKDAEGHGIRYKQRKKQPGEVGCRLYIPQLAGNVLQDPTVCLRFTEGEKKAAKACQEGYPTIGLGGLWNFLYEGKLLPRFDDIALDGRRILLVPDGEVWNGRNDLLLPVYRFGKLLEERGARVEVEVLPNTKLDDLLVAAGDQASIALDSLPKIPLSDELFKDVAGREERRAEREERSETTSQKPTVQVNNRELWETSEKAQRALLAQNNPAFLFVRSGQVSRIVTDESSRPIIETVGEAALRGYLTRAAEFVRVIAHEKKEGEPSFTQTRVSPPRDVVQDILSLPDKPFPPLLGVVECPVLRPDGSILSTSGHDAATRLFYHAGVGLQVPDIPEHPSQALAAAAAVFLQKELLIDFPFMEPADKTNFLGCLLTPVVRPAISGNVPLALLDKPTPGSGASLLSDLIATIVSGEHAAKLTAPEGRNAEAEWTKKITALLLDGSPIGVIDNIENDALSSTSLSRLLTAGVWKERLLGGNVMATLPVRCTLIATGNNLSLRGDLARRSYRMRLDPGVEKPWERDGFRHPDILQWTREQRGTLLAALLTMAQAWFVAGQPKPKESLTKLGGFEEWVRIVGGILAFSGLKGFLSNQQALYDLVDDAGPQWRDFLSAWFDQFGNRWMTVRYFAGSVLGASAEAPLVQSIPEEAGWDSEKLDSSRTKLGIALKKQAFRVYGQYKLERGGVDKHSKGTQWRVAKI